MKKSFILFVIVLLFLGAYAFIGRTKGITPKTDGQKINILASFYPLYFFTSEIAGEKATVGTIVPAGAEPHDYEPTSRDVAAVENSSILVLNGDIEPWADNIKENLKGKNTSIVEVGEGLFSQMYTDEDGEEISDPHVWLSPVLAKKMADVILTALIEIDSPNASLYTKNTARLSERLDDLDGEFKAGLADCQKHDIVTSHAAFGYMASAYGLRQVAIAGLTPDEEPSLQRMREIADFARVQDISYIFFETLLPSDFSDTIAREVGAQTLVLNPLEGLSDEERAQGKDYFTVMQENLQNLRLALACR